MGQNFTTCKLDSDAKTLQLSYRTLLVKYFATMLNTRAVYLIYIVKNK